MSQKFKKQSSKQQSSKQQSSKQQSMNEEATNNQQPRDPTITQANQKTTNCNFLANLTLSWQRRHFTNFNLRSQKR